MKHRYINLSISSIIAMMTFAISPATVAETDLDILDANANALFSDQDIISVHHRRYNRRHHRRYNRYRHHRRYNRYGHHRRYNRYGHNRRYNRYGDHRRQGYYGRDYY